MKTTFIASILACCLAGLSQTARAQSLDSCGDIHVEAEAMCELVPPGAQCEASCTPISVEAACAAELQASCDGQCEASAEVDCQGQCELDCADPCELDPGKFDCRAECVGSCGASCAGQCEASGNRAECEGSCQATCDANCNASCDIEVPELDCDGKCEASCEGECEAKAEFDCQIDCQAMGYAECKLDIEGRCDVACETQEGALFCDGQYVDHGNNLEDCVAAIEAVINANVEGYAEGESSCEDGSCMASGKAGVSCSALPGARSSGAFAGAMALLSLALVRRRRGE